MKWVELATAFAVIVVFPIGAASAADKAQCDKLEHDFQQQLRGAVNAGQLHDSAASLLGSCPNECEQLDRDFQEQLRKVGGVTNRRLSIAARDILFDCANQQKERAEMEQKHREILERSRQAPPVPQVPPTWRQITQSTIEKLVNDQTAGESSGWGAAAINLFRNRYAGGQGTGMGGQTMGGQVAQLGRFMSAQLGVGSCTRHFYNNSGYDWAVAMIYAGSCHLNGQSAGSDAICIVPPHQTAELDYYNNAETSKRAKISIASASPLGTYAVTFKLNIVGCHIEHNGATGQAALNNPADGDVVSSW